MKKLLLTLCLFLVAVATWAVKAWPLPVTITQPDGTELTVIGYGDEDLHWYTTTDGVLLVHIGTAFYVAKVTSDGNIEATSQLAHERPLREVAELSLVKAQDRELFYSSIPEHKRIAEARRIGVDITATPAYFPHEGSPRAIVILVEFSDVKFTVTDPYLTFNEYLNSEVPLQNRGFREDRNFGSVRQYFTDISGGKYTPVFDVYGPITLPKTSAYYGIDYQDSSSRIDSLMKHACERADGMIDFSQYDSNSDGYVDLVYLVYAGFGENYTGNSTDYIWPKSGSNISGRLYDGVTVQRYGIGNELNYGPDKVLQEDPQRRVNGIGLFCHEFSHTLGLPDMYPRNSVAQKTDNQAMEYWDIMDNGEYTDNGYTPTPYTPWEKEVMGWVTLDTLQEAAQVVLHEDEAYKILQENSSEYLIVHNIQNKGWAMRMLGHGMLVYRVDYKGRKVVNLSDYPNNTAGSPGMTVVCADGLLISAYKVAQDDEHRTASKPYIASEYLSSHYGDPFPGTSNVHELPSVQLNKSVLEKGLYNINEVAADGETVITFAFIDTEATDIVDSRATDVIESIIMRSQSNAVYDLQGRRVAVNADATTIQNLPKGIYIVGGHKVIVK